MRWGGVGGEVCGGGGRDAGVGAKVFEVEI
jgi:hypothetical protein